jgi:uncharacterized membrane protein YphA (DoxX/SURF4 family)
MTQKTQNIILWILAGLLAFAFFGSGVSKLMGVEMQVKNFDSWGYPQWLRYPIGITEILFAIGLLMASYRKTVVYGVFVWAIVAIGTHIQAGQVSMVGGPIFFSVFAAAILWVSGIKAK